MFINDHCIVVRLAGGLGNQFFQFGAALRMLHDNNYKCIILDKSALSNYKVNRSLELEKFIDFEKCIVPVYIESKFLCKFRIPRFASFNFLQNPFVGDRNYKCALNAPASSSRVLDGYFQTQLEQNDFDIMSSEINKLLVKGNCTQGLDNRKICVIHIRGKDFVSLGLNYATSDEYYSESMDFMSENLNVKDFVVVTDDVSYAKNLLKKTKYKVKVQSGEMLKDFITICQYSNRILSSSTFALWASTIGNNRVNSLVITPPSLIDKGGRSFFLPNEV